jgi:REP element-mobilizing transposase RayT
MRSEDACFFDPAAETEFLERRLPHLGQRGTFAFVTFRLIDSVPQELVRKLRQDRQRLLAEAGLNPNASNVRAEIDRLPKRHAAILRWKLFSVWDDQLDELRGQCFLRNREVSQIVADGLMKFDGQRYVMATFAVMPNHVHLLAAFAESGAVTSQGAQWRRFFARKINPLVDRTGHLWQEDQFDHLVRNEASFERIRRYIVNNPAKANLPSGQYRLYVSHQW